MQKKKVVVILVFLLTIGVIGSVILFVNMQKEKQETGAIEVSLALTHDESVRLEVADTLGERIKGLSGRASLPTDTGLLFIFPEADTHGIWMKDMNFPIDVVWLNEAYEIVHIVENMDPASYPTVYKPPLPSLYVIEFNAGFIREKGIELGTILTIDRS